MSGQEKRPPVSDQGTEASSVGHAAMARMTPRTHGREMPDDEVAALYAEASVIEPWPEPYEVSLDVEPSPYGGKIMGIDPGRTRVVMTTEGGEVIEAPMLTPDEFREVLDYVTGQVGKPIEPLDVEMPDGGVLCPECVQGKCVNCTRDVLTDDDTFEPCQHRVDKVHP